MQMLMTLTFMDNEDRQERGRSISLEFVGIVISAFSISKVIFEVVIFLDFNLNIYVAPIYPDCPWNFCDP